MLFFILKRLIGAVLLAFGLLALVTPLTPGSWLALIGLELLGLTWLLPRPIRVRWTSFKTRLWERWHTWKHN